MIRNTYRDYKTSHQAGDIYAARGAGAIGGEAHFMFTLADMGKSEAEDFGVSADDQPLYLRLDDAKRKLSPPSAARWFERVGVHMPYGLLGEEVGVLVPWTPPEPPIITPFAATQILEDIQAAWKDGNPYGDAPNSKRPVIKTLMMPDHGLSKSAAKDLLSSWLKNKMVASERVKGRTNRTGLMVLNWPGEVK